MLNISPFTYGLVIEKVYDDGSVFDPAILDITDDQLRKTFLAVSNNFPFKNNFRTSQLASDG